MSKHTTVFYVIMPYNIVIETEDDLKKYGRRYEEIYEKKYNEKCKKVKIGDEIKNYFTLSDLEDKYYGISSKLKRGDLVLNLNLQDDLTDSLFCFDGKRLIDLDRFYSKNGNPSETFKLIKEFPPGYWDELHINSEYEEHPLEIFRMNPNGTALAHMFWHETNGKAYSKIDISEFGYKVVKDTDYVTEWAFTYRDKKYIVISNDFEYPEMYVAVSNKKRNGYDYVLETEGSE